MQCSKNCLQEFRDVDMFVNEVSETSNVIGGQTTLPRHTQPQTAVLNDNMVVLQTYAV